MIACLHALNPGDKTPVKNSQRTTALFVLVLAVAAAVGGWFVQRTLSPGEADAGTQAGLAEMGAHRPDFRLPDLDGVMHGVSEWEGKVLVVNFWATWCPPCLKEMPAFVELQEKYGHRGLQFVGIAIDRPEVVRNFMDSMAINYPVLIGDLAGIEVGRRYGNRLGSLPYTVVVDRDGQMVFSKRGELSRELAEDVIRPLL